MGRTTLLHTFIKCINVPTKKSVRLNSGYENNVEWQDSDVNHTVRVHRLTMRVCHFQVTCDINIIMLFLVK